MITGIKHIIFDLGNVLLNIDPSLSETAFKNLCGENLTENISDLLHKQNAFHDLECGRISGTEFADLFRRHAGAEVDDAAVFAAWNALLLDFPLRRLQILQQLQLHYDLILLSNTNEVHEAAFNAALLREHGIPNIGVFFDKVFYSHRLGLRKPDPAIFQVVLDQCGFQPSETLFIDDLEENVRAAESLGIKGIWLEPGMTIEDNIFLPQANS